jgi:hypothetical protein
MINLVFPKYPFRQRELDGKRQIFDALRKRWVLFTPEEWVRQNFLQYMLQQMHYPTALIAIEKELQLGERKKRFDILLYNQQHQPWLMVECKAMDVSINDAVVQQILTYNMAVPVPYLVVTNGIGTWAFKKREGKLVAADALPVWETSER